MKRRNLLAAIGTVATLGGCLNGNRAADPGDGGNDDPAIDASGRTTGSDCGGARDDWAVAFENEDAIRIEGTTPAPNPCHDASVENAVLEDGHLELTVGVETTLEGDVACVECVGAIAYRVSVEGNVAGVETATVTHAVGSTHDLEVFGADAAPQVETTDIETLSTDCGSTDEASATLTGPFVTIQGSTPAPDPCHVAELDEAKIDDGVLTVAIDRVPDEEAEVCMTCIAEVEYEATIELAGPPRIDEIQVAHRKGNDHVIEPEAE